MHTARERVLFYTQGTRSSSTSLSLSPYTNPTHTHHARTEQSRTHARPHVLHTSSSHDSWMSPRVAWPRDARPRTRRRRATPHDARTHHDFRRRRHEDDDESDVGLVARLSRRVDHREQRCRSEAGAFERGHRSDRARMRGMNEMRTRGVGRAVVVLMRDDRGRGTTRARGDDADRWMRGREKIFLTSSGVSSWTRAGWRRRGVGTNRSIARSRPAPRIRARGGEG